MFIRSVRTLPGKLKVIRELLLFRNGRCFPASSRELLKLSENNDCQQLSSRNRDFRA